MNTVIKFATVEDVPLILQFIKELAKYEKLLHEVFATEELLKNHLFGEKKYAEVILAYTNNNPVGFALFYYKFSAIVGKPGIYLEDLYTIPEMRGQGVAKKMLAFLAQLTLERGGESLEWLVLDWNKSALDFYRKIGAKSMDEFTMQRVTGKALYDLGVLYTVMAFG